MVHNSLKTLVVSAASVLHPSSPMRALAIGLQSALTALLGLALVLPQPSASACGWDGPYFVSAEEDRDAALARFAGGSVGLFSPNWRTSYLITSYRWLHGAAIGADEQTSLRQLWSPTAKVHRGSARQWSEARNQAAGDIAVVPSSNRQGKAYSYYLNCGDNAFDTAEKTLAKRVTLYARSPGHYLEWLRGQDIVFANCGGGQHIPTKLGLDAPLLLRKDRDYQIAAALFYSGKFSESRIAFDAIASDRVSPWQGFGAYLSVRAVVREASLGGGDALSLHRDALARLGRVLANADLAAIHPASRDLLDLVRYRIDPVAQLDRLGVAVERGQTDGRLALMVMDIRQGLNDLERAVSPLQSKAPLIEWLRALREGGPRGYQRARAGFATHGSSPWLVAALSLATPRSPGLGLLFSAADAVDPTAPAFLSVKFHHARLLAASGQPAQARSALAVASVQPMPVATRNAYAALQLATATTWKEWSASALRHEGGMPVLHADARRDIRERFSLKMLLRVGKMGAAGEAIRREVLMAGFVRAVVQGNRPMARRMAEALARLTPALGAEIQTFLKAKRAHQLGVGALLVLRNDGVFGEPSYRDSLEDYSQSCAPALFCSTSDPSLTPIVEIPSLRSAIGNSAGYLAQQGTRLDGLGARIESFAVASPSHELAPEALHLLVRATRRASMHGTSTKRTGELSKRSFQILQRNYQGTSWARNTRYWYR